MPSAHVCKHEATCRYLVPEYTELKQGFIAWANLRIRLRKVALTLEDIHSKTSPVGICRGQTSEIWRG